MITRLHSPVLPGLLHLEARSLCPHHGHSPMDFYVATAKHSLHSGNDVAPSSFSRAKLHSTCNNGASYGYHSNLQCTCHRGVFASSSRYFTRVASLVSSKQHGNNVQTIFYETLLASSNSRFSHNSSNLDIKKAEAINANGSRSLRSVGRQEPSRQSPRGSGRGEEGNSSAGQSSIPANII